MSDPTPTGVRTWLPLVGNGPLQLPDAVQLVAVDEDQEIVADCPRVTEVADSVRVGTAGAPVLKLTEFTPDAPAALIQVKMY